MIWCGTVSCTPEHAAIILQMLLVTMPLLAFPTASGKNKLGHDCMPAWHLKHSPFPECHAREHVPKQDFLIS